MCFTLTTVELSLNEQIYLGRLVAEHLAHQVEHFVPVLVSSHLATLLQVRKQLLDTSQPPHLSRDVPHQRLALPPHVSAARALLVPPQLALGE